MTAIIESFIGVPAEGFEEMYYMAAIIITVFVISFTLRMIFGIFQMLFNNTY